MLGRSPRQQVEPPALRIEGSSVQVMLFALLNAVAVAISSTLGGVAARRMPLAAVLALSSSAAFGAAVVLAFTGDETPSTRGLLVGIVAGLIGGAGIPLAYKALAFGPVGVAATLIACSSTLVVGVSGVVAGNVVTPPRAIGLTLCIAAVTLVSRGTDTGRRRSVGGPLMAIGAGLAFGAFALAMNSAPVGDGWWPLVAARAGVGLLAVALVVAHVAASNRRRLLERAHSSGARIMAVCAGLLDTTANVFLLLSLRSGDLLLVAILTSVAPALTATLGWLLLRERLTPTQIAGVAPALVSVSLAST